MSLSILSWQVLTAHAQPFRGARDLVFCLKIPLDSLLVWASSGGSGKTAQMRRLAWTFAARICDKYQIRSPHYFKLKPEDHWSCIAHLSVEDMLKSAVIEEKKFKHSPWEGADNPLGPKFLCHQEDLITMVICWKFKKNLFNLWVYIHLFMIK